MYTSGSPDAFGRQPDLFAIQLANFYRTNGGCQNISERATVLRADLEVVLLTTTPRSLRELGLSESERRNVRFDDLPYANKLRMAKMGDGPHNDQSSDEEDT